MSQRQAVTRATATRVSGGAGAQAGEAAAQAAASHVCGGCGLSVNARACGELDICDEAAAKLGAMSAATIDR